MFMPHHDLNTGNAKPASQRKPCPREMTSPRWLYISYRYFKRKLRTLMPFDVALYLQGCHGPHAYASSYTNTGPPPTAPHACIK